MANDYLAYEEKIALGILLLPEQSMGDLACGVIYGPDEAEPGASPFQPVVAATINLQKHTLLRVALSSAAVFWWPSLSGASYPRLKENAAYRRPAESNTLPLRQQLGKMLGITTSIG